MAPLGIAARVRGKLTAADLADVMATRMATAEAQDHQHMTAAQVEGNTAHRLVTTAVVTETVVNMTIEEAMGASLRTVIDPEEITAAATAAPTADMIAVINIDPAREGTRTTAVHDAEEITALETAIEIAIAAHAVAMTTTGRLPMVDVMIVAVAAAMATTMAAAVTAETIEAIVQVLAEEAEAVVRLEDLKYSAPAISKDPPHLRLLYPFLSENAPGLRGTSERQALRNLPLYRPR